MAAVFTWPVGRASDSHEADPPPPAPIVAYVLTCAVGGALTGLVLGALVLALRQGLDLTWGSLAAVAIALSATAATLEWRGRVRPLPERRKQVPRIWLHWRRRTLTAAVFGLMLGCGALTHLRHATVYVLVAAVVVSPSVGASIVVGAVYGLCRGATLAITWAADRLHATRPRWPVPVPHPTALNRALALAGISTIAVTLIGTY